MDDADDTRNDALENDQASHAPFAVSSRYGVCSRHNRLEVSRLQNIHLGHDGISLCKAEHSTIVAFSAADPTWLTVATGTSICNYDLESGSPIWTLRPSHRAVTALAWTETTCKHLAVGCIDGSVGIWSPPKHGTLKQDYPQTTFAAQAAPCDRLQWLYDSHEFFAALYGHQILIWSCTESTTRPVMRIKGSMGAFVSFQFQPVANCDRVATIVGHELQLYQAGISIEPKNGAASDSDESDSAASAKQKALKSVNAPYATVSFETSIAQIQWISSAVILVRHGCQVSLLDVSTSSRKEEMTLWCRTFSSSIAMSSVEDIGGTLCLVTFVDGQFQIDNLPPHVVDRIRSVDGPFYSSDRLQLLSISRVAASTIQKRSEVSAELDSHQISQSATMKPIRIPDYGKKLLDLTKTSNQLEQQRQRTSRLHTPSSKAHDPPSELQTPPGERSMTSSLELPKTDEEQGHGSPIPFLSPNIPARQSPQTVIASLDDSVLELPPLPDSFTGTPLHAVGTEDDDDSDDETFADGLQHSGTFLPGGINVPLPKACGALFAPNGQLLTFFPPKVQQAQTRKREDSFVPVEPRKRSKKVDRSIRLFPSFGNLGGDVQLYMDDSDSTYSEDYEKRSEIGAVWPDFQLQPSSFPSQQSWNAQVSPAMLDHTSKQPRIKVNISVYELEIVSFGVHVQQGLAQAYRLLREDSESAADVCSHNAQAAEKSGLKDIARVWRLFGMLMDDKVPLRALPSFDGDVEVLVIAKQAISLWDDASAVGALPVNDHDGAFAHLRWGGHPFGKNWLIRSIFEWAERSADVQHLACFAAVLAGVNRSSGNAIPTAGEAFMHKLASDCLDYDNSESSLREPHRRSLRAIPSLRSSTPISVAPLQESPVKSRTSNASSRNASQPATPYLDPVSTTPPFSLPSLSRQGTRLSTSGSASPETHRSSFSAAAKYYAQSITDKFASYGTYGTSPPLKKTGTSASPRDNELSTSLPGGSWTKSVSFAASSTAATNRGSQLSRSFEHQYSEDAYDSDKTLEDSSAPHTPKLTTGDILVTHRNQSLFDDEVSGGAKAPLLPTDIAEKATLWIDYYAEQLRNWGLFMTAAEMEKITGIMSGAPENHSRTRYDGIKPSAMSIGSRAQICAICTTLLQSAELVCPDCLHTSHLSCFAEYTSALDGDELVCPTGCGCACSELPYVVEQARLPSPQTRQTFKKKPSFTDPMLWRRRNEGDTW